MLIFLDARLAFLATPKTATTAIETALGRHADIVFQRGRKHMPARRFHRRVAPFVARTFGVQLETVAMMREPLEHLRSWYSYRKRVANMGRPKSTQEVTFDHFVADALSSDPPEYAWDTGQFRFLTTKGDLAVTHLFSYAHMDDFRKFMVDRLGEGIHFDAMNVSPKVSTELRADTQRRLLTARSAEFELYDRLMTAGGYLHAAALPA